MAIDYSKWDKFGDESEGSEGNGSDTRLSPVVTRLDRPSCVNIPGRSDPNPIVSISESQNNIKEPTAAKKSSAIDYSKWDHFGDYDEESDNKEYFEKEWYEKSVQAQRENEKVGAIQLQTPRKIVSPDSSSFAQHGSIEADYIWGQTEEKILVYIPISSSLKAKEVSVSLTQDRGLCVKGMEIILLNRVLYQDVWGATTKIPLPLGVTSEEKFAREMEWELLDLPKSLYRKRSQEVLTRCIAISFFKVFPGDVIKAFWWPKAFVGNENAVPAPETTRRKDLCFGKAWEEAHTKFRENIMGGKSV